LNKQDLIKEYDDFYNGDNNKWTDDVRNDFAYRHLEWYTPKRFLDIGCGNGHTIRYFQKYFDCEFYGLDLSPVACTIARKTGATIEQGFIEDYEPDVMFDMITCMGVAEHFVDVHRGLTAIKSILDGVLYLEVPNCLSYSPGGPGFRRLERGSRQWEWHLPRETWEEKIKSAGFEIVENIKGNRPFWEFVWVLK
jgi:SAM-dependent methyltransferase